MEASIEDTRIVYQAAPASMPSMRRLLRQKPSNQEIKQSLLRVNAAKYFPKEPDELSQLFSTMKLRHLEVCVCKPLLMNLQVHFGGGFKKNPGVNEFERRIESSRRHFEVHRQRQWKSQKGFESMSGLTGRSALQMEIGILGLTLNALEPFTENLWCRERAVLTPCTLRIERGGNPAQFRVCFAQCENEHTPGPRKELEEEGKEEAFWPLPRESKVLKNLSRKECEEVLRLVSPPSKLNNSAPWCCSVSSCSLPRSFNSVSCSGVCVKAVDDATAVNVDEPTQPRVYESVESFGMKNPMALLQVEDHSCVSDHSVPEERAPVQKDLSSDFWGAPAEVSVQVLKPEVVDLPDPVTVPELNFPSMCHT
eukprot:gnl/MRDRNA2_/MRDRNA2_149251_c0_seq1.p1 gnl/MRDRNA2_/MRDRNA2_149251_c0~~gnl/MRDRNA2_/MRDRNA2_149251_c0_seq1.p1  ORF type:complete len:385 (+),score=57.66 gnl/MRDRNA2_/MRDRNA2_149251_c0_seq1:58-1155(+)